MIKKLSLSDTYNLPVITSVCGLLIYKQLNLFTNIHKRERKTDISASQTSLLDIPLPVRNYLPRGERCALGD